MSRRRYIGDCAGNVRQQQPYSFKIWCRGERNVVLCKKKKKISHSAPSWDVCPSFCTVLFHWRRNGNKATAPASMVCACTNVFEGGGVVYIGLNRARTMLVPSLGPPTSWYLLFKDVVVVKLVVRCRTAVDTATGATVRGPQPCSGVGGGASATARRRRGN